jgi:hypothetical protein
MCANCSHPNCDPTRAKLIKEFQGMIKSNIVKDDAAKLVYYDSGAYLKDFRASFLKLAERQRAGANEQFDTLIKLIEGIS